MAKFPTYEEMGKKVAEKALDEFLYDGKSIREWMQIIASEDAISRKAVLDVTWEEPSYTDALNVLTEVRDKVKALPPVNPQEPKSECEHDHEILKAYSDGASDVLDEIKADIEQECKVESEHPYEQGLRRALEIIDRYRAEGSGE